MITAELHHKFNLDYRANANNNNRTFYSYEIDYFLNKAQDIIVERYYKLLEKSEKARAALEGLIKGGVGTYVSNGTRNYSYIYSLPIDCKYILEEFIIDSTNELIKIKPTSFDGYLANRKNPYKNPYNDLVWRIDTSPAKTGSDPNPSVVTRQVELITDGRLDNTTITSYNISYIKVPNVIDMINYDTAENELGDEAQEEMIIEAVRQAYATIKDVPGVELQSMELKERIID